MSVDLPYLVPICYLSLTLEFLEHLQSFIWYIYFWGLQILQLGLFRPFPFLSKFSDFLEVFLVWIVWHSDCTTISLYRLDTKPNFPFPWDVLVLHPALSWGLEENQWPVLRSLWPPPCPIICSFSFYFIEQNNFFDHEVILFTHTHSSLCSNMSFLFKFKTLLYSLPNQSGFFVYFPSIFWRLIKDVGAPFQGSM